MTEEERKEAVNLAQVLAEVPDDVLINVMASRMKNDPEAEVRSVIQTVSRQQVYGGPIPPPIMLEEYERTQEGLADRIVSMAEAQQKHRHTVEEQSVGAAIKAEARGQHYALIVSLVIILGSLYLIDHGKEIAGSILAGGTLVGLAYTFITGRKREHNQKDTEDPQD